MPLFNYRPSSSIHTRPFSIVEFLQTNVIQLPVCVCVWQSIKNNEPCRKKCLKNIKTEEKIVHCRVRVSRRNVAKLSPQWHNPNEIWWWLKWVSIFFSIVHYFIHFITYRLQKTMHFISGDICLLCIEHHCCMKSIFHKLASFHVIIFSVQ